MSKEFHGCDKRQNIPQKIKGRVSGDRSFSHSPFTDYRVIFSLVFGPSQTHADRERCRGLSVKFTSYPLHLI
jgi:hypothetical protein